MRISLAILSAALLASRLSVQSQSRDSHAVTSHTQPSGRDNLTAAKSEFAAGELAFSGRNYVEAQRRFEQVTQLAPQWPRGWKALGVTLALQNNLEEADFPLRKACELSPAEPDACYYLARGLYARDKFLAALRVLYPLLRTDPEPARIEEAIAQAKEGLGEFDEAEKWYRQASEHDARRRSLAFGRFLLRQGRLHEGLPLLKRAAQYQPDSGFARLALGQAYLEAASLEAGSEEQAVIELTQAVRLLPHDEAARHLLQKAQLQQAAGRR
jgi:Flp pilus assembly protein TadD